MNRLNLLVFFFCCLRAISLMCLLCNVVRTFQALSVFNLLLLFIYHYLIHFKPSVLWLIPVLWKMSWDRLTYSSACVKEKKRKDPSRTIFHATCFFFSSGEQRINKSSQRPLGSNHYRVWTLLKDGSSPFLYEWDNQRVFSRQTALLRRKVCEKKKQNRRKAPVITLSAVIFYGDVKRL